MKCRGRKKVKKYENAAHPSNFQRKDYDYSCSNESGISSIFDTDIPTKHFDLAKPPMGNIQDKFFQALPSMGRQILINPNLLRPST